MIFYDPYSPCARIMQMQEQIGPDLIPLFRSFVDGTLNLRCLGENDAPALDELHGFGVPTVVLLPAERTWPDQWAALPALRRWARIAVVLTGRPSEHDLDLVTQFALDLSHIVLVSTRPHWSRTWSEAFLPRAAGVVLGGREP